MVGAGERRRPVRRPQGRNVGPRGPSMRALLMLVAVVALLHARLMSAVEEAGREAAHPRRSSSSLQARIVWLVASRAAPAEAAADATSNLGVSLDASAGAWDGGVRLGSMSPVDAAERRPESIAGVTASRPVRTPPALQTPRKSVPHPSVETRPSKARPPSAAESIAGPPGEALASIPRSDSAAVDPAVGPNAEVDPAGSMEAGIAAIDAMPPRSPSAPVQGGQAQAQAARPSAASGMAEVLPGTPVPTYPTRPPPAAILRFSVHRGAGLGTAELVWRPRPEAYTLTLEASNADGWQLAMASAGAFYAAGLAPVRFTERRARRSTLATNFRRASAQVSFSATPRLLALREGEQDRLSWLVQLGAIAAADPAFAEGGTSIALPVAGLRGESEVWRFDVIGTENVSTSSSVVSALRLHRAGPGGFEPDVDVWLDPARHHLPLRVSWRNGVAAQALELLLEHMAIEP